MRPWISVLIGAGFIAAVLRSAYVDRPVERRDRIVHFLGHALMLYGAVGFFAGTVVHQLDVLPMSREWPVLWPGANVKTSDGNTVLGLMHAGRVQLYDPSGRFVRGWFVESSGGSFKIREAASGNLEVFTARGEKRLVYRPDGVLLESGSYSPPELYGQLAAGPPGMRVVAALPLWPLAHPFVGGSLTLLGMATLRRLPK